MNGHKPLLRLLILSQTFLLFAVIILPLLLRYLHQTSGKILYGVLAAFCIGLVLLLRRAIDDLD
jgi:hypothetical protein